MLDLAIEIILRSIPHWSGVVSSSIFCASILEWVCVFCCRMCTRVRQSGSESIRVGANHTPIDPRALDSLCFRFKARSKISFQKSHPTTGERCAPVSKVKTNLGAENPPSLSLSQRFAFALQMALTRCKHVNCRRRRWSVHLGLNGTDSTTVRW